MITINRSNMQIDITILPRNCFLEQAKLLVERLDFCQAGDQVFRRKTAQFLGL